MSRERDESLGLPTMQTAEGLAVYPLGSWGGGYFVDTATVRQLRAWAGRKPWWNWLLFFVIGMPIFSWWIPHHPFFAGLACGLAYAAIEQGVVRYILRHCPRTSIRLKAEKTEAGGVSRVSLMCGLVSFGSISVLVLVIAIVSRTLDAWLFAATFALCFGWFTLQARRDLRRQARSA